MAAPTDYIAFYKLENDANDETGNYNGTVTGTPLFNGQSVTFNGLDNYINTNIPMNAIPGVGAVSIWVKTYSSYFYSIFINDDTADERLNCHFPHDNGNYYFDWGVAGGYNRVSDVFSRDWYNTWVHFVLNNTAEGLIVYMNDFILGNGGATNGELTTTTKLILGYAPSETRYASCSLANLRLYNRELTEVEISDIYKEEKCKFNIGLDSTDGRMVATVTDSCSLSKPIIKPDAENIAAIQTRTVQHNKQFTSYSASGGHEILDYGDTTKDNAYVLFDWELHDEGTQDYYAFFGQSALPWSITYKMEEQVVPIRFWVGRAPSSVPDNRVATWKAYGSNNNTDWTELVYGIDIPAYQSLYPTNTSPFMYFKFEFITDAGANSTVYVDEVRIFYSELAPIENTLRTPIKIVENDKLTIILHDDTEHNFSVGTVTITKERNHVNMLSASENGFVAYATSEISAEPAFQAFDNNVYHLFSTDTNPGTTILRLEYPEPVMNTGYNYTDRGGDSGAYSPSDWEILGGATDDVNSATVLHQVTDFPENTDAFVTYNFTFTNTTKYKYYFMRMTANGNSYRYSIRELEFLEDWYECDTTSVTNGEVPDKVYFASEYAAYYSIIKNIVGEYEFVNISESIDSTPQNITVEDGYPVNQQCALETPDPDTYTTAWQLIENTEKILINSPNANRGRVQYKTGGTCGDMIEFNASNDPLIDKIVIVDSAQDYYRIYVAYMNTSFNVNEVTISDITDGNILKTTEPIKDGDNLVIVKDDNSIHEVVADSVILIGAAGENNSNTTSATPTMTSDTTPSGECWASSVYNSTYAAYKSLDNDESTFWITEQDAPVPIDWQYKFYTPIIINKYIMTFKSDQKGRVPKDFTLEASNIGNFSGEQIILDTRTGVDTAPTVHIFTFTNSTKYLYYRIHVTSKNDSSFVSIGNIKFIEAFITYKMDTTAITAGETPTRAYRADESVFFNEATPTTNTNVYNFIDILDTVDPFGDNSGIALYKLDGNANDESGNYNGTEEGTVTYGSAKFGQGLYERDMSRENGIKTANFDFNVPITVSVWLVGNNPNVTNGQNNNSYPTFNLSNYEFSMRRYNSTESGASDYSIRIPLDVNTIYWTHFVIIIDYPNVNVYANCKLVGSGTMAFNVGASNYPLSLHYSGHTTKAGGIYDHLRIFNRVLTLEEIKILYIENGLKTTRTFQNTDITPTRELITKPIMSAVGNKMIELSADIWRES